MKSKNTVYRALRIVILLFYVLMLFLSIRAGHYVAKPLAVGGLIALVGLYNIANIRKNYRSRTGDNKEFNRVFLRSLLLTILIMFCLVVGTVLWAVYGK